MVFCCDLREIRILSSRTTLPVTLRSLEEFIIQATGNELSDEINIEVILYFSGPNTRPYEQT